MVQTVLAVPVKDRSEKPCLGLVTYSLATASVATAPHSAFRNITTFALQFIKMTTENINDIKSRLDTLRRFL